ncbi:MAG TPA: ATP-dependent DNA helicase UvrD2 [Mycobacteriales bacterium]|nr:ATP-dependent DNA helicase UvrD2 [Mycobacteriales bacterium]
MPPDPLAALDPEQRQAAEAVRGPVCILAGAGTGKTRAITHRIAHMVHSGTAPAGQILAVTFTTRAAGEMRGRLRGLGVAGVQARTFHSAALRQLQYFWPRLSAGPRPTVVETKLPSIRAAAARLRRQLDPAGQRDVASEIEWAKAALVPPDAYAKAARAAGREPPVDFDVVQQLFGAYEDVNAERGQLDFEDLLLLTAAAIEEQPDIAREVRERYRYFVVDEYQDVNPLQQRLLEAWLGDRDDLCVVGDPNQTIYSFTGASPAYLLEFPSRFHGTTVVRLVRDYRSTNQVVALANALLPESRLAAQGGDGPDVVFAAYDDEPAEAAAVVTRVQALAAQGVPLREMAVLFRVNAQSEVYEAALAGAGVPYVLRGGERFFERPEVRQAMVLLRGAHRSASDELAGLALPAAVTEVLGAAGLTDEPPSGRGAAREKWDALRALVGLAEELHATDPTAGLEAFTAELAQRADAQHAPAVEGVTLASLHAAKGLEWDAVFLVGLVDGTLPITHATTAEQVAEEKRLLYVGITRSRRHLHLSWSAARAAGGQRRRKPSRFLDGLRPKPPRGAGVDGAGRDARPAPKPKATDALAPADEPLFEALREWRRAAAEAAEMPPYIVFSDRTLVAIATARPATRGLLARVSGVGPKKLEEYGDDVLAIVTSYDEKTGS